MIKLSEYAGDDSTVSAGVYQNQDQYTVVTTDGESKTFRTQLDAELFAEGYIQNQDYDTSVTAHLTAARRL